MIYSIHTETDDVTICFFCIDRHLNLTVSSNSIQALDIWFIRVPCSDFRWSTFYSTLLIKYYIETVDTTDLVVIIPIQFYCKFFTYFCREERLSVTIVTVPPKILISPRTRTVGSINNRLIRTILFYTLTIVNVPFVVVKQFFVGVSNICLIFCLLETVTESTDILIINLEGQLILRFVIRA